MNEKIFAVFLVEKMYGGFLWQQHYCPNVEWLLKADDDTVVHLGQLDYWIKHKFRRIAKKHAELIYFGRVLYGSKPHRDPKSKSYVPKSVYSKDEYPSYMSGAVYLTTTKTIAAILPRAAEIVAFHIDDALFTGILADLVNATRSLQKQHILRVDLDGDATCENGMSTAIAIFFWWEWKGAERSNEHYQCLKSWKSKCG